jgi:DNA-binding LytR/AlgR family response regulator
MEKGIHKLLNKPMRCLIIDDEAGAIEGIINYINKLDFLKITGTCYSALEAVDILKCKEVDLMFLDINMPYLSGINFLESLEKAPLTILTTAYSEYALDGFRLNVVDYLLKPVNFQRFSQAIRKASDSFYSRILLHNNGVELDPDIYIRQGDSFIRILWKDILYVESMQNYIKIHVDNKIYLIHQTMSSIEDILPKEIFFRIHRSYLINVAYIDSISGGRVFVKGKDLPLSKYRKDELFNALVYKRLASK